MNPPGGPRGARPAPGVGGAGMPQLKPKQTAMVSNVREQLLGAGVDATNPQAVQEWLQANPGATSGLRQSLKPQRDGVNYKPRPKPGGKPKPGVGYEKPMPLPPDQDPERTTMPVPGAGPSAMGGRSPLTGGVAVRPRPEGGGGGNARSSFGPRQSLRGRLYR